jgi:hypothetical protein
LLTISRIDSAGFSRQFAGGKESPFASLRTQINSSLTGTLREDLFHLKRLGLIDSRGHGRGAVWFLAVAPKPEKGEPNKAQ